MAALAAEGEWIQNPLAVHFVLGFHGKDAVRWSLEGGVDAAAGRKELVETESKYRLGSLESSGVASVKGGVQALPAERLLKASLGRQTFGDALEGLRVPSDESVNLRRNAEGFLDPCAE